MHINLLFIIMTFVVVCAIILLSDNLTNAVLIITLLANLLVLFSQIEKRTSKLTNCADKFESGEQPQEEEAGEDVEEHPYSVDNNQSGLMYGNMYAKHDAYNIGYINEYDPIPVDGIDGGANSGIDGANALMARRRARDKKCSDGWAVKDANYFKFHYADELDEAEQKRWWGNKEY